MSVNWKDPCIWRPWLKRERRLRNEFYREKEHRRKERLDNPTPAEARLQQLLLWHFPQYYFEREADVNGYSPDFYFPRLHLIIEIDGSSHIGKEKYDEVREQQLRNLGQRIRRFTNDDVFFRPSYVISKIKKEIHIILGI